MSNRYLLGIDNGGTVIKAALFDEAGRQIAVEKTDTPTVSPEVGFCERDLSAVRAANFEVISRLTRVYGNNIAAVGISGHGKGLYVLDGNRREYYPGIASTDNRALSYEIAWKRDGTAERIYPKTAQNIMACQPVSLLRWLKDNRPEVYRNIGFILSCKDYVRFCLTGEINAEYTDVSGTNLLSLATRSYDPDLLDAFGIPEVFPALPPIISSEDIGGYVTEDAAAATGLLPGTPVVGGMFDIDACALSLGCISPGDTCVIAGTWSINECVTQDLKNNHTVSMNSVFCRPEYYLAEESSACSAGNLEWFRRDWKDADFATLETEVSSVSPDDCPIYYLPYLYASNTAPNARACLVGLSAHHTRAHAARAVYEGVVYSHLIHIDRLFESVGRPPLVRLAGGVVHSQVWSQMFCDAIGVPVEVMEDTEMGAKGAAMAAGVGCGLFPDSKAAVEACVGRGKILTPDAGLHAIYRKKFENFKRVADALAPVWDSI